MNPRRWGLVGVVVVVVAAFGLALFGISSSVRTFRTGYTAARSIDPGATLTAGDVRQIRIASADPYTNTSSNPIGKVASHQMATGHLLDNSDFLQGSGVEVPITLENAHEFHAGDRVDVAAAADGKLVLVGRGITMLTSSTAQVPAKDETSWLALAADPNVKLFAARSGPGAPAFAAAAGAAPGDAISALAARAALAADAGPTSSAAPSHPPTAAAKSGAYCQAVKDAQALRPASGPIDPAKFKAYANALDKVGAAAPSPSDASDWKVLADINRATGANPTGVTASQGSQALTSAGHLAPKVLAACQVDIMASP